jgi:hypothetical protein
MASTCTPRGFGLEPVEVAVEDQALAGASRALLGRVVRQHLVERRTVAIEAADDAPRCGVAPAWTCGA